MADLGKVERTATQQQTEVDIFFLAINVGRKRVRNVFTKSLILITLPTVAAVQTSQQVFAMPSSSSGSNQAVIYCGCADGLAIYRQEMRRPCAAVAHGNNYRGPALPLHSPRLRLVQIESS